MTRFRIFCCLLLCLGIGQGSFALQVTGLFAHRIAVANESPAERDRAMREAFAAVILKVTGQDRWLAHPAIEQARQNAQNFVQAVSYSSETLRVEIDPEQEIDPDNPPPTTREQRYIDVDFSSQLIQDLLTNAGIPIWDSNRPSALVWMALQDATGNRRMMTGDVDGEIINLIQEIAADRGLPVIFPVLDFEDRQNLTADTIWSLDEAAIRTASARYGADSVLAGRLHFTATGELVGLWQFLFQDNVTVFDGLDTALQSYLEVPLTRITNELASYFAILPGEDQLSSVRLRIDGVGDLTAYSALVAYVSSLGLVETVTTAAVDGTRLELQLGLLGNPQQLAELIALDRDLIPIDNTAASENPFMHYRWTR